MGKKPMVVRTFRVPEKLWNAARDKAEARDEDVSDVLREALIRYVSETNQGDS